MRNSELAKGSYATGEGDFPLFPEDAPLDESGNPIVRP
jgi:hypothetical protein